jgi:mono/diheme cytochrome c family protein
MRDRRWCSACELEIKMKARSLVVGFAAVMSAAGVSAGAQETPLGGDPQAGRAFALEVCAACHVVSSRQLAPARFAIAPSFHAVANTPGMTAMALKSFLTTPHKTMPNLILHPDQAADVVAYILSLRDKP